MRRLVCVRAVLFTGQVLLQLAVCRGVDLRGDEHGDEAFKCRFNVAVILRSYILNDASNAGPSTACPRRVGLCRGWRSPASVSLCVCTTCGESPNVWLCGATLPRGLRELHWLVPRPPSRLLLTRPLARSLARSLIRLTPRAASPRPSRRPCCPPRRPSLRVCAQATRCCRLP